MGRGGSEEEETEGGGEMEVVGRMGVGERERESDEFVEVVIEGGAG